MTTITIPLIQGRTNYISFPATSSDNFETIFTSSGIINDIPENRFTKFNPRTQSMEPVNYTNHIEKGVGYEIFVNSPANIIYEGIEFTMTFDEITPRLLPGWNLIGVGTNIMIPLGWCKIFDSDNNVVTQLYPMRAYWINDDHCTKPTMSYGTSIAIIASTLVAFAILKQYKVI